MDTRTALSILFICAIFLLARLETNQNISKLPQELKNAVGIETALQSLPEATTTNLAVVRIPIFIYHSVREPIPNETAMQDRYDITPELFERQLAYLKNNGYTVITIDQVATDIRTRTTGGIAKPVVLTFDDGEESQYTAAFPLLKKYGVTATFYVYTNVIGKKYFLNWNQIKKMDSAGMTIGGHTLSHPYLITLSPTEVRRQIEGGKKILAEHLCQPLLHLAAPFRYTDKDIMAIIKLVGYTTGRTTFRGAYQDDPYKLRGFLVSDNFGDFLRELNR